MYNNLKRAISLCLCFLFIFTGQIMPFFGLTGRFPVQAAKVHAEDQQPDKEAPGMPADLKLVIKTDTYIEFEWTASADNIGVTGYEVYRNGSKIADVNTEVYSDRGLAPNTDYTYTIKAYDAAGNRSESSAALRIKTSPINDTEAPSKPTGLIMVSKTANSVSLSWAASTDNLGVYQYVLCRDYEVLVGYTTATSITDDNLPDTPTVPYTVCAIDEAGNMSEASEVLFVNISNDNDAPTAPSNLKSTAKTATTVSLTWDASTDNVGVEEYILYRNGEDVWSGTDTSYIDRGLVRNTNYKYTVKARDAARNLSSASNEVAVTTNAYTGKVAKPVINPVSGMYGTAQTVTVSCATEGATIKYTTDGNTPTWDSAVYATPISVLYNTSLKVYAEKDNMENSDVASAEYTIKVATPTFSPAAGTYTSSRTVTISCATSGVIIKYTTDGSTPTASSTTYTAPITVSATKTVKAYAIKSGMADSDVASAAYTIMQKVAMPAFSPTAGTYTGTQTIAISCVTSGAVIKYTTDGSTPTASSTTYTTPITVSATKTVKAYAIKSGMADSDVASAAYTITQKVAMPAFSPTAGIYTGAQTVAISCATSGAVIKYTTDGSTPTTSSTTYTAPITVSATKTVKAYAIKSGMADSDVASAAYTISTKVATPTFSPAAGVYSSMQIVTISCTTSGAAIKYTTDGSTPTASSTTYTAPITVSATKTVKAYAIMSGITDSDIASATYTISLTNIALNKNAISDSEDKTNGNTAPKAVDGNTATCWSAADTNANHWLTVNLNGCFDLTGTETEWQFDRKVYKYQIEVSKDNVNWVVKADKSSNTQASKIQADIFTADRIRYIRIKVTGLETGVTASIAEFKVFGRQSPPDTQPPTAPASLECTYAVNTSATINWAASTDNDIVTGYKIYKGSELKGTTTGSLSYTATGLTALTSYTFTVKAVDASGNESPASQPLTVETGIILEHDTVMESLTLNNATLDLNGYRLTINTNLVQAGGVVNINKGYLEVKGDYRIEKPDGNASTGTLKMVNSLDYVKVSGNFIMHSSIRHTGFLTDGILEIRGNFSQKNGGTTSNFKATGNHKTVMNGQDVQTISFENSGSSMMNIFEINKPLEIYEVTTTASKSSLMNNSVSIGTIAMEAAATGTTPFYNSLLEQYKSNSKPQVSGGVDPATGGYSYSGIDMVVKVPGFSLDIGHSYNSLTEDSGILGKGWTFSMEGGITTVNYSNAKQYIVKLPGRGEERFLDKSGTISGLGTRSRLELSGGTYTLTTCYPSNSEGLFSSN